MTMVSSLVALTEAEVESHGDWRVQVMVAREAWTWGWVPTISERIYAFSSDVVGCENPHKAVRDWTNHFCCDSPLVHVIGFFKDGDLVGHILITIADDEEYGARVATMRQWVLDSALPTIVRERAWDGIKEFLKRLGADVIVNHVLADNRPSLERAYRMLYGFERHSVVMRVDLREKEEDDDGE